MYIALVICRLELTCRISCLKRHRRACCSLYNESYSLILSCFWWNLWTILLITIHGLDDHHIHCSVVLDHKNIHRKANAWLQMVLRWGSVWKLASHVWMSCQCSAHRTIAAQTFLDYSVDLCCYCRAFVCRGCFHHS